MIVNCSHMSRVTKPDSKCAGFTIVEMTIYIGLLTIFLFVLTQMFFSVLDIQLETESTSSVIQDGRYVLSRLMYDAGRAQAIVLPANPGDQSGVLQLSINGEIYTYSINNGNLTVSDGLGAVNLNSFETTASGMLFTRLGNDGGKHTIQTRVTLTSAIIRSPGSETTTFQTTIGLR